MSQAPWTLFWPRSGFTPTPSRPILPVAMARLAIAITVVDALAVLGDAEAVIDRAVAAGGVEPRGAADQRRAGTPVSFSTASGLWRGSATNSAQSWNSSAVAALADEGLVDQAFGDDDVRQRGEHGDVGAGLQRQVIVRLDMRRAHQVDAARIDDDQLRALAQALLHAARRTPGGRRSGLAPITMITSACSTQSKSCVPAEVPKVVFRP